MELNRLIKLIKKSPHVVLLGAGASRVCLPDGVCTVIFKEKI